MAGTGFNKASRRRALAEKPDVKAVAWGWPTWVKETHKGKEKMVLRTPITYGKRADVVKSFPEEDALRRTAPHGAEAAAIAMFRSSTKAKWNPAKHPKKKGN